MGEQDRGYHADRIQVSYWDEMGNETVRNFAANLPDEEIPDTIDHPLSGSGTQEQGHKLRALVLDLDLAGLQPLQPGHCAGVEFILGRRPRRRHRRDDPAPGTRDLLIGRAAQPLFELA